jgi:hypothetical protein
MQQDRVEFLARVFVYSRLRNQQPAYDDLTARVVFSFLLFCFFARLIFCRAVASYALSFFHRTSAKLMC